MIEVTPWQLTKVPTSRGSFEKTATPLHIRERTGDLRVIVGVVVILVYVKYIRNYVLKPLKCGIGYNIVKRSKKRT